MVILDTDTNRVVCDGNHRQSLLLLAPMSEMDQVVLSVCKERGCDIVGKGLVQLMSCEILTWDVLYM